MPVLIRELDAFLKAPAEEADTSNPRIRRRCPTPPLETCSQAMRGHRTTRRPRRTANKHETEMDDEDRVREEAEEIRHD
jgi:hypothetical protein